MTEVRRIPPTIGTRETQNQGMKPSKVDCFISDDACKEFAMLRQAPDEVNTQLQTKFSQEPKPMTGSITEKGLTFACLIRFVSRPAVMVVVTTQMGSEPPLDPDGNTDLTKSVQQGRSFLEVARLGGGNVMKSPPIPMKNPTLINGLLGFSFTDQETKKLADDLKFALVLKFLVTRPNIDDLR
ncbi:ATP synthase subunit d, mitochondrial [Olea europaea subsp. europaea]|uniref:ATP synthase subunit d, mitochondrial n=1 Tax=Olea europaea subsp. europaea TaxID=158383 RepID=A0A8S0QHH4_OLEEU|nr:ATP synthase subunit d, mitochondrial [Olea europaea subsp. europaea]